MLLFRQQWALTQTQAGDMMGLTQREWSVLERYLTNSQTDEVISTVALGLGIEESEITPPSFKRPVPFADLPLEELSNLEPISHDEMSDPLYRPNVAGAESKIAGVLLTLTYREREVLKLRYGLGDGYTYTYDEIAKIFSVSIERARQIEAKAIRKLQHPVRAEMLVGYLPDFNERRSARATFMEDNKPKISRLGKVIRWYLKKHNMSQMKFAQETGLTSSMIGRLISNHNVSAGSKTLAKLAKYWEKASRAPKRNGRQKIGLTFS